MLRRPSQSSRAQNNWVSRTPSGLPICHVCGKELGFCSHSEIAKLVRQRSSSRGEIESFSKNATESGTIPGAIAMNKSEGTHPTREDAKQQTTEQKGKKRRLSNAQQKSSGKAKQGGGKVRRKVGVVFKALRLYILGRMGSILEIFVELGRLCKHQSSVKS